MIPKRVRLQFETLLHAAQENSLCVVESSNRKTGKPVFLLCAHNNTHNLFPLAQMGQMSELHHPMHAGRKLI